MDLGITGKRALVTGAGRGIGASISQSLANAGCRVGITSRTESYLEALLEQMGGENSGHLKFATDLTEEGEPDRLVKYLKENDFFPIDILIHNMGGTLEKTDPFCSIEDWRTLWRFNMEVAIELNLALVPAMQGQGWGRVVMISSISSFENHGPVPYCSIKAALTAYARGFGRVVAPDGVVVNAVLPGAVYTEGGYWDDASKNRPDHVKKYLDERMAIKRFGDTEEIANPVLFLCSKLASFFTGSAIVIDGGQGRGVFT